MTKIISPVVKTHGGKYYLWKWIRNYLPINYTNYNFFELFVGGGSLYLNLDRCKSTTINDLDMALIDIYKLIYGDEDVYKKFISILNGAPYTKESFKAIQKLYRIFNRTGGKDVDALELILRPLDASVAHSDLENDYGAILEFVMRRQSRSGQRKSVSLSKRFRGGHPEHINNWLNSVKNLDKVRAKQLNIHIENRNAIDILREIDLRDDASNCLIYLDPPYVHETRCAVSTKLYKHEMTNQDHKDLLNVIKWHKSKILISGYDCSIYNEMLKGWKKETKLIPNHSNQDKVKKLKMECLWINYLY